MVVMVGCCLIQPSNKKGRMMVLMWGNSILRLAVEGLCLACFVLCFSFPFLPVDGEVPFFSSLISFAFLLHVVGG